MGSLSEQVGHSRAEVRHLRLVSCLPGSTQARLGETEMCCGYLSLSGFHLARRCIRIPGLEDYIVPMYSLTRAEGSESLKRKTTSSRRGIGQNNKLQKTGHGRDTRGQKAATSIKSDSG